MWRVNSMPPSLAWLQAEYYRDLLSFPNNYAMTKRMAECLMYERAKEVGGAAAGWAGESWAGGRLRGACRRGNGS